MVHVMDYHVDKNMFLSRARIMVYKAFIIIVFTPGYGKQKIFFFCTKKKEEKRKHSQCGQLVLQTKKCLFCLFLFFVFLFFVRWSHSWCFLFCFVKKGCFYFVLRGLFCLWPRALFVDIFFVCFWSSSWYECTRFFFFFSLYIVII